MNDMVAHKDKIASTNVAITRRHAIVDLSHRISDAGGETPREFGGHYRPEIGEPAFRRIDPNVVPHLWESECGNLFRHALTRAEVSHICDLVAQQHVVQIRGLPTDRDPPPSPNDSQARFSDISVTLQNMFGLIDLIGGISFAYATENGGRVIRHVVGRKNRRGELSSQGWGSELPWHVDGAFRPMTESEFQAAGRLSPAPRWLVFGVIYGHPEVPLSCVCIDDVVSQLPENYLAALSLPQFDVQSADSFATKHVSSNLPIIVPNSDGDYFSRFSQGKCWGTNRAATEALDAFSEAFTNTEVRVQIALEPGDVVILDNFRSAHRRNTYTPRWDGRDRWLVRLYAAPAGQRSFPLSPEQPRLWT